MIGLTFLAPAVAQLAIVFGPPEYASLMLLGLSLVMILAGASKIKAVISGLTGFLLSTIGLDSLRDPLASQWARSSLPTESSSLRSASGSSP